MSAREIDAAVLRSLKTQLKILRELGVRIEESKSTAVQEVAADTRRMERDIETYKAERIRQYEAYAEGVKKRKGTLQKGTRFQE